MSKIISTSVLAIIAMMAVGAHCGVHDLRERIHERVQETELPYSRAINAKLCESGGHTDDIATKFFDCYKEDITPGGDKFIECQKQVYEVQLDSEENISKVCAAPRTHFPLYAACVMTRLVSSGNIPSTTLHKLNECQGAVVGVPRPT